MKNKTGRFSGYIRPFTYVLDLIIVILLVRGRIRTFGRLKTGEDIK